MTTESTADLAEYQAFQRRTARKIFTFSVMAALMVYLLGYAPAAKGLVLGALFSVVNFVIMAQLLPRQVGLGHQRKKATGAALFSIVIRLGLLAVPLFVALKSEGFHLWAVVVGLFAVPIGIMVEHTVVRRFLDRKA
ncbi:MAG: ATP synthase subunit I [Thermodesulfobacteriota bacterium]|nr:ATP synthase subunit I [Thermodesulfobacteriota bacterium]